MKCIQDIKFDIMDKIGKDLTEGGLFRYGATRDVLHSDKRWNGTENTINMIVGGINKRFKEDLLSVQPHEEGFQININPSDDLAREYLKQYQSSNDAAVLYDRHNEIHSQEQAQRGYIIDNTGENTDRFINFSPEEETVGVYEKFIRHKETLLKALAVRMNEIETGLRNPKTTVEQRTTLNNLKQQVKTRMDGDVHRGIKGLKQEIGELRKMENANVDAVGYYVEQDLSRLAVIANSNNPSDLKEAQLITEFYNRAGTFQSNVENPFFAQNEIFFADENGKLLPDFKLAESVMNQYKEWRDQALGYAPAIDMKQKDAMVDTFNDVMKRSTGRGDFNYEQIVHTEDGLKDIDWVSAWAMDVTQAIFSQSAKLAQVMHTYLVDSIEKKENWSREYAHKMNEISPRITKRLGEIDGGKYQLKAFGILGVNGVSYDLYLDRTKNGQETGSLVQRFTVEFEDAQREQNNKFRSDFDAARMMEDAQKPSAFNKAFEANKTWKRANTVMMNPAFIQEIIDDPEYADFATGATQEQIDDHKRELVSLLGQRGYEQQVNRQKTMLNRYKAERQSYIDSQMIFEGVDTEDALTPHSKFVIKQWENQHNPTIGVEDYNSSAGVYMDQRKINSYMDYNNTIPRNYKVKVSKQGDLFHFESQSEKTGFYNENFKTIEGDDTLREFYDLVKEGNDRIREVTPYDMQTKMAINTLPMLMKTSTEFLLSNDNGKMSMISAAWRRLWERIRLSFGLVQQSEISYATKDPLTGKYNYQVNSQFLEGNSRARQERETIEKIKFQQAFNVKKIDGERLGKVGRFTTVKFNTMNAQALAHIAQMLNIDISMDEINSGRTQKIKNVTGEKVEIGKIIRDFATHSVVQAQSFDLPKLMKHFTHLAMGYTARTEALPIMEIMKRHYEGIKDPKTNNVGNSIFNVPEDTIASEGTRENAVKQMEDWFQRVMLDNYGIKHFGVHGDANRMVDVLNPDGTPTGEKETKIPFYGKLIYSNEEKEKIKEIDKLLSKVKDPEKIKELNRIKEGFGKVRTASASITNFLALIRTLGLGWNLSSAITNFAEGYTSNMVLASSGQYFNPEEIYYAYSVGKHSWLKNTTFGLVTTDSANKARELMDRYNVLLDSKNELQKSTTKTNLSRLEALNPHEINARVEYINQSPIMIAMLRTEKIKDSKGNESNIWDVMDREGKLIGDYRTEENLANWENLTGERYLTFKNKMNEAIVKAHGNYDEMRGMMVKSNLAGKTVMMFKTWLPAQLYWRFAEEQESIKTGDTIKGRYRSFTPGTFALFGAGVGAVMFGPVGIALLGAAGVVGGKYFGMQTEFGALKEMVYMTKALTRKALGMPVNIIAGRNLIDSSKDFEKWVGSGKFTELDAKNMRGNMADLAIIMTTLALMLLVKGFFWDDDDDKDSASRQFHNYAVNKLMQLASQATMYVNPNDLNKTVFGSMGPLKFLENLGKEVVKIEQAIEGHDPGAKKLGEQSAKFLPGMFKDIFSGHPLSLGFATTAEKQFTPTPYDKWFKSAETKAKEKATDNRKARSEELEEMGYKDKGQRTKILNIEIPTPKQLQKKGMTLEEWKEQNSDYELPEPLSDEEREAKKTGKKADEEE